MVSFVMPELSYVFVFLLVFAVVYGILSYLDIFKRKDINAIIALSIGLITLLSSFFVVFVSIYIPMVVAIALGIFLVILLLATTLTPTKSVTAYLGRSPLVAILIITIMLLFGLEAFSTTLHVLSPPSNTTNTTPTINPNVSPILSGALNGSYIISLLTSPNTLALIISFIVMLFGVYFMTRIKGQ